MQLGRDVRQSGLRRRKRRSQTDEGKQKLVALKSVDKMGNRRRRPVQSADAACYVDCNADGCCSRCCKHKNQEETRTQSYILLVVSKPPKPTAHYLSSPAVDGSKRAGAEIDPPYLGSLPRTVLSYQHKTTCWLVPITALDLPGFPMRLMR